jgi:hypothetical protein
MEQTIIHTVAGTCCPDRFDWIENHCYHCGRAMSDECNCMESVVTADDREESESCEAGTPGCSVNHTASSPSATCACW